MGKKEGGGEKKPSQMGEREGIWEHIKKANCHKKGKRKKIVWYRTNIRHVEHQIRHVLNSSFPSLLQPIFFVVAWFIIRKMIKISIKGENFVKPWFLE